MARRTSLREQQKVGLDYIQYLEDTDRGSVTNRRQLTDIYNSEFRNWKDLNFGKVLYALTKSRRALACSGNVIFNPQERTLYQDQWRLSSQEPEPLSYSVLPTQNRALANHLVPLPRPAQTSTTPVKRRDNLVPSPRPAQTSTTPVKRRDNLVPSPRATQTSTTPVKRRDNLVPSPRATQTSTTPVKRRDYLVPSPRPTQTSATPSGAETGLPAHRKLASLLFNKLTTDRAQLISDRNGVSVTSDHELTDGKISFCVEGVVEYVVCLYVENSGPKPVYFTYYSALHQISCFILKDEHNVTRSNPLQLRPGAVYKIQVLFRSSLVGFYPATLAFEFKQDLLPTSTVFHIVRFIEAQYLSSLARELAPIAPFKPRSVPGLTSALNFPIEDGQPLEGASVRLEKVVALAEYKVPQYARELVLQGKHPGYPFLREKVEDALALLESPLSSENYGQRSQLLLYLEELQMEVDIKRYNMEDAPMDRDKINKNLLILEVPGVSENRPSVLRGDQLLVRPSQESGSRGGGMRYRGYVHRVELEQVKLGLSHKLLATFIDGMKFNVEFTVNRLTMRVQQRAAELVSQHRLGEVLFPTGANHQQMPLPTLRLFDRQLEQNPEQYKAVQHIVAGSSKPAPYLVFGPPGTGKTVTVVEAIKQIEKTQGSCHILACAPSNSAADLLCKNLLEHVEKRKVFRMYASSRNPKDVPAELLRCSNLEGESFVFPAKEELMQYKIMVTTLITAGRLVTGGIPPGHYTHVFVDEAGHAVETECIIPLAGLLQITSGQVVLAGDPKQLGPILRSPLAMKHGMTLSLLERLMKYIHVYQKDEGGAFNNCFVTKLLRNYRSHPAILNIPNELFYDGELQVCANEMIRNSYCRWEHLPRKDFPMIFHGVAGRDEREANSPSFFNVAEVEVLMAYLKKLLETQGKKGLATISLKDIGIIAPYRKQVEKIRKALKSVEKKLKLMNIQDLKVGSVEEFQGQERKVILVSTVRSTPKYIEFDQKFTLGFVKNEKRFNVAVTRAKALLIVVGNPRVLKTDPTWARFIRYCSDEGGHTGFSYTDEEEEEMVARLADLYIHMEPQVETEESVVQQHLDPEWRNDL